MLVRGDHAWVRWPVELAEGLAADLPDLGLRPVCAATGTGIKSDSIYRHLRSLASGRSRPFPWRLRSYRQPIDVALPDRPTPQPALLRLVRDERVRPARALRCRLESLAAWAETVPTSRITALQAAIATDQVLVLGTPLPAVAEGTRYGGTRCSSSRLPVGSRPLGRCARRALNVAPAEFLLLTPDGSEVVPHRHVPAADPGRHPARREESARHEPRGGLPRHFREL